MLSRRAAIASMVYSCPCLSYSCCDNLLLGPYHLELAERNGGNNTHRIGKRERERRRRESSKTWPTGTKLHGHVLRHCVVWMTLTENKKRARQAGAIHMRLTRMPREFPREFDEKAKKVGQKFRAEAVKNALAFENCFTMVRWVT